MKTALIVGLAVLLVMMSVVPMMGTSFAESVPPMPNGEGEDGEYDERTCPFSGKKSSVNMYTNF